VGLVIRDIKTQALNTSGDLLIPLTGDGEYHERESCHPSRRGLKKGDNLSVAKPAYRKDGQKPGIIFVKGKKNFIIAHGRKTHHKPRKRKRYTRKELGVSI